MRHTIDLNWVCIALIAGMTLCGIAERITHWLREKARYRAAAAIGSWPDGENPRDEDGGIDGTEH
jgi:hypothetical protein